MKKILLLSVMFSGICMNAAAAMNNDSLVQANPAAEAKEENATPVVVENVENISDTQSWSEEEVEVSTEESVSPLSETEDVYDTNGEIIDPIENTQENVVPAEENLSIEELEKEKRSLIGMIDYLRDAQRVAQAAYVRIYNEVANLIKRNIKLVAENRSLEEQNEKIYKNIANFKRLESENKKFQQSIQTLKSDLKFERISHVVDVIGVSLITAIIIFKFMDINDVIRACIFVRRYFNYEYLWSVLRESSLYGKLSQGILAWW